MKFIYIYTCNTQRQADSYAHACMQAHNTTHKKATKELMGLMWVLPTKFVLYIYKQWCLPNSLFIFVENIVVNLTATCLLPFFFFFLVPKMQSILHSYYFKLLCIKNYHWPGRLPEFCCEDFIYSFTYLFLVERSGVLLLFVFHICF